MIYYIINRTTPLKLLKYILILFITSFLCCHSAITFAAKRNNVWQQRTISALKQIDTVLLTNTMQALDKPESFNSWMSKGKSLTQPLTAQTTNKAGYYFTLSYYSRGFNDPHIHTTLPYLADLNYKFAGMLLRYSRGKYYVYYRANSALPPIDSVLTRCDGKSIGEIVDSKITPFYSVPNSKLSRYKSSNFIFFDANPFRSYFHKCTFDYRNKTETYQLHWKNLTVKQSKKVLRIISPKYQFKIDTFTRNDFLISLPTFEPDKKQQKQLQKITNSARVFNKNLDIIIDLRGNNGGNDKYWLSLINKIYGKKYIESLLSRHHAYPVWRVSKLNSIRIQQIQTADFIKSYNKSLAHKQLSYTPPPDKSGNSSTNIKSKFSGKIYWITDHQCVSSCLDFADLLHKLPNSTQLGLPTGTDTSYIETNSVRLPGGATLQYTMKVWRLRKRKAGEYYEPQYYFDGDITNTAKLKYWASNILKTN